MPVAWRFLCVNEPSRESHAALGLGTFHLRWVRSRSSCGRDNCRSVQLSERPLSSKDLESGLLLKSKLYFKHFQYCRYASVILIPHYLCFRASRELTQPPTSHDMPVSSFFCSDDEISAHVGQRLSHRHPCHASDASDTTHTPLDCNTPVIQDS